MVRDNGWQDPSGDITVPLDTDVKGVYSSLGFSTANADNPSYDWQQTEEGETTKAYGEIKAGEPYTVRTALAIGGSLRIKRQWSIRAT